MPVDRGAAEVQPAGEAGGGAGADVGVLHGAAHAHPSLQDTHAPQEREAGFIMGENGVFQMWGESSNWWLLQRKLLLASFVWWYLVKLKLN